MYENKQYTEITNFIMVVECYIYCRRKIEKFFWDIISIYTGVSNRYNV
jgi:hypothetical protein